MKLSSMAAALLACGVACPALAGDAAAVEPGLRLAWTFGADAATPPALSLGLYPSDLGWRRLWADTGMTELAGAVEKPAVLDLRFGEDRGLHLMGLPLDARTLRLNAEGDESAGGMRYMRPALIVLAAGVATALAIGAAGDAAEDNNPTVNLGNNDGDGGDAEDGDEGGVACINGECVLPCGSTGPVNNCSGG